MALAEQIALCSEALVLVGDSPITTLDGDAAGQQAARHAYNRVVDARLSHPYLFNRKRTALARISGTMPAGSRYSARFALPSDHYITIVPEVDAWPVPALAGWEEMDGYLELDAAAAAVVSLRYHGRVDERVWSSLFRRAIVFDLGNEFALSVRESPEMANALLVRAEAEFAKARNSSAQQAPMKAVPLGRYQKLRAPA